MNYFRPKTIEEAITLKEKHPDARYIAGGLSFQNIENGLFLIDLQQLPKQLVKKKNIIEIGSTHTLENILPSFAEIKDVITALQIEASKNLRNQITLGGFIKKANGRSPFLCCLAVLNCWIYMEPGNKKVDLNQFHLIREVNQDLITKVELRIPDSFHFESIGRSPLDKPIICCASSKYGDVQLLSLGGFGSWPMLINSEIAANSKNLEKLLLDKVQDDQWASAEYRISIAKILINRMLA